MGGLFGGGGKKKSSGSSESEKSTTADSIETADGTVYDRRGSTTASDNMPKASPVAVLAAPAVVPAAQPQMPTTADPMQNALSVKRRAPSGTIGGASYGFG